MNVFEGFTGRQQWSYLTDYDNELMTTIIFRQGLVSETKQTPWVPVSTPPEK